MTAQPLAPHPVAAHALSPMLCSSYVQGSSYAPFDWYPRLSALPADARPSVQSSDGHARPKASKPRRQSYDVRFKLKVVRAALARPPGQRIKPTCRDFPDIEPVQLRKWIRNLAALEVASPTKRCLSAGARREHAALDDEAEHASDASSLPTIPNSPVMESPSAPEPAQCGKAALSPPLPQQQHHQLQQQHHHLQQQQHQLLQQHQHQLQQHHQLQQQQHHLQQQQQQHLQQQQQQQQYNQPQHPSDQPPPHHTPPRPSDQQPAPPPPPQQQQPHLHAAHPQPQQQPLHLHLHLHQPLHHSLEPPLHHPLRHSFHPHHAPSAAESAYCGGYSPHHSEVWLPMQQYLPHAEIPRAQQLYGAHQPLKQWLLLRQRGMAPPLLPREMPYPPVQRPVPVRTAPPPTAAPASPSLSPFSPAAPPAPAASTGDRLGQKEQLAALELIHMASAE